MLLVSAAVAEVPSTEGQVTELVQTQLLRPLYKAQSKRKMFSRAAPTPLERRVRVLDTTAQTDSRGKQFMRFAVDQRYALDEESAWQPDSIVGCAYPGDGKVFVKNGDDYLPARSLLGGDHKARPDVCRAVSAAQGTAQTASL
jgi:hypothetical protein